MSLAGLRFGAKSRWNLSAPAETKSGSYIFAGDPSEYHDWEFRTKLRIRMYEEALKSKKLAEESKAVPGSGGSSLSGKGKRYGKGKGRGTQPEEEEAEDEERVADERTAFSMEEDEEDVGSMTPQEEEINLGSLMSPKSTKGDKKTDDDTYDRSSLVHRVLEGLRGDAFLVARDMGLDALATKGGLDELVERIRKMVFPRATEEARELFRAGQRVGGPLARQQGESMVSYCSRRRRWWRTLCELDPTISLSESMRAELMLELSGLSRQEQLVVKACATPTKSGLATTQLTFEAIADVLIEQYASVHLRWSFENTSKGTSKGTSIKGKGKFKGTPAPFKRVGFIAENDEWDSWNDEPPYEYENHEDEYEYTGVKGF